MTETKTTSTTAHGSKTIKGPAEAIQEATALGKKAFMAYAEAGADFAAGADKLARAQAQHMTTYSREAGEVVSQLIESGIKARETARQATLQAFDAAFTAPIVK